MLGSTLDKDRVLLATIFGSDPPKHDWEVFDFNVGFLPEVEAQLFKSLVADVYTLSSFPEV